MLISLVIVIHVVISFFLIAVVLLQQGKGADLSVFGGGGTMTAFGAQGAATLLHKLTVISFVLFIVTTMIMGLAQTDSGTSSVMSGVPTGNDEAPVAAAAAADDEATTNDPDSVGDTAEPAGGDDSEGDASGDTGTDTDGDEAAADTSGS